MNIWDYFNVGLLGMTVALMYASIVQQRRVTRELSSGETLETRIEKLTDALKVSSKLVSEVESEIQARKTLVGELQRDAKEAQLLASLNKEQVGAVVQAIGGEMRRDGKKSFWMGFAVNFIFFLLGSAAPVVVPKLFGT